jgi:hypothetical protein
MVLALICDEGLFALRDCIKDEGFQEKEENGMDVMTSKIRRNCEIWVWFGISGIEGQRIC